MKKKSDKFVANATKLNIRRSQTGLLLLKGSETLDAWLNIGSNTAEFYAEIHSRVSDILYILIADPKAQYSSVLEVLLNPKLNKRYPEINYVSAEFAHLALAINYVISKYIIHKLLAKPLADKDIQIMTKATKALWANFNPSNTELSEPWQAKEILLMLAFERYDEVVHKIELKWELDFASYDNSHLTLIKLGYLIAKCKLGFDKKDFPFYAKSLITLTQFNYYQWSVNYDITAKIELSTMVLASLLYYNICESGNVSTQEILGNLEPAKVVNTMHELLL